MDRVIKFRGKRKNHWIYGGISDDKEYIVDRLSFWKVDPETVSEFTGFKDIDGKEIFEDDIIQNDLSYDGEIYSIHVNEGLWVGLVPGGSMEKYTDFNSLNWLLGNGEFKVIGNIHDNPELLKGRK